MDSRNSIHILRVKHIHSIEDTHSISISRYKSKLTSGYAERLQGGLRAVALNDVEKRPFGSLVWFTTLGLLTSMHSLKMPIKIFFTKERLGVLYVDRPTEFICTSTDYSSPTFCLVYKAVQNSGLVICCTLTYPHANGNNVVAPGRHVVLFYHSRT